MAGKRHERGADEPAGDRGGCVCLLDAGRLAEINDYCRCDVLDTYFVFLRSRVLAGQLSLEAEQSIIADTKQWLQEKADQVDAYQLYLEHWGDWVNPWKIDPVAEGSPAAGG